jgi:hypothetical protein
MKRFIPMLVAAVCLLAYATPANASSPGYEPAYYNGSTV